MRYLVPGLLLIAGFIAVVVFTGSGNTADYKYPPYAADDAAGRIDGAVLVFGATGGTGSEVTRVLARRGTPVTAFVRPTSDRSALAGLDVDFVEGDAMDRASIDAALADADYAAVVTTIGCLRCDPPPDFIGNKNIFDAAAAAGVQRVVLVSTVGAGDSKDAAPWAAQWFLADILPLKTEAEDALRQSALDYTILRPGALKDGPATGDAYMTEDRDGMGIVTRADLGQLIVDCLDDPGTIGKTFAVLDRNLTWPWGMF